MTIQARLDKEAQNKLTNILNWLNKNNHKINEKYSTGLLGFVMQEVLNSVKPIADMDKQELHLFEQRTIQKLEYKLFND